MAPDDIVTRAVRDTVPSVCPHDCTSTCALVVERLGGPVAGPLGRVLGVRSKSARAIAVGSASPAGSGRIDLALRVTALAR